MLRRITESVRGPRQERGQDVHQTLEALLCIPAYSRTLRCRTSPKYRPPTGATPVAVHGPAACGSGTVSSASHMHTRMGVPSTTAPPSTNDRPLEKNP